MLTELGKIQEMVTEAKDKESKSPLKEKLDEFGETLTKVIGIICIVVWVINYKNFFDDIHGSAIKGCIYYFKISVSLAVAAIPEGLPAVITTCLALGTKRMTENNALIRKLDSIETLGCTTVICSDKTGTLTTNNMTMTRIMYFNKNSEEVRNISGVSYDPCGEIENFQKNQFESIRLFTLCSSLCNGATIEYDPKDKAYKVHGTPTEAALKIFVEKAGLNDTKFKGKSTKENPNPMEYNDFILNDFKVLFTLEFDRDRKAKSVLALDKKTNKVILFTKGAYEILIDKCDTVLNGTTETKLEKKRQKELLTKVNDTFTNNALRTLAVCCRTSLPKELSDSKNYNSLEFLKSYFATYSNITDLEQNLTLLGIAGIKDPPREEVKAAIETCFGAGIKVIMITGDNKLTAEAIAQEIGLVKGDVTKYSFHTSDFFKLSQEKQLECLRTSQSLIFSRSDPKHKMTLVTLLKGLVNKYL